MNITAKKMDDIQPALEYGVIEAPCEGGFLVVTDMGAVEASAAVSCLVAPVPGDVVLLSIDGMGRCYILSILERPQAAQGQTELSFDGDVNLAVRGGRMSITSDEALSFASGEFELNAHQGTVRIDNASFFGRAVENHIARLKIVAEAVDSIVRRAVQRFTSSYRYVEEHEEVQSASMRMIVDGTLTMHTKNTMHIAEGHVKIDAEQIHLG
ncbi:MAG TPA: DUF3540 domain-containing protein [Syntrophorhabdaceae bacterium]|nr:DUF3540 domain-containing protein [Syntrophorhabdaceae bacterium]